jgi:hypothetical protein
MGTGLSSMGMGTGLAGTGMGTGLVDPSLLGMGTGLSSMGMGTGLTSTPPTNTVLGVQTYTCPTSPGPNGFPYVLNGTKCIESCPSSRYTYIPGPPPMCKENSTGNTLVLHSIPAISSNTGATGTGLINPAVINSIQLGQGLTGSGLTGTGFPSAGLPSAGLPSAGFPSAGLPSAGFPSAGLPSSTPTINTRKGSDVTLRDLQDLTLRINVEIIRLESSGAADAFVDMNIQSRINILVSIKKSIDDLINEIQSGRRNERDIPFMKADIDKFLPAMSNLNTPLPQLVRDAGMSSAVNSLFPMFGIGDVSGSVLAREMMHAYGKNFLDNLSWDVAFSYKGKAEQQIASNNASAARQNAHTQSIGGHASSDSGSGYRGFFDSITKTLTGGSGPAATSSTGAPAHLDWKERTKQICTQVKARGYDPYDFGCFKDPDTMKKESFSWRGHARMICTRLNTIYDPSIPVLCGCPPPAWPGWKQ